MDYYVIWISHYRGEVETDTTLPVRKPEHQVLRVGGPFGNLDTAQKYAKGVDPSRKPVIVQELPHSQQVG